jgi:DNA-binding MarR family transcriptional regulator
VTTLHERNAFRREVAKRAGLDISPGAIWALVQLDEHGPAQAAALAQRNGVDPTRVDEVVGELRERGLLAGEGPQVRLTDAGREYTRRAVATRRDLLAERLADRTAERSPELEALLRRLSRELCGEPPARRAAPAAQPAAA